MLRRCFLKTDKEIKWYNDVILKTFQENADKIVPIKKQIIYAIKDKNKIIALMSTGFNKSGNLDLENEGFSFIDTGRKFCEGLYLYKDKKSKHNPFEILSELRQFVFNDLQKKGYETIYFTCNEKNIFIYKKFNFEILNQKEKKFLLKYDLKRYRKDNYIKYRKIS